MTLFGTIWYKLEADNVAGVQSIVSVIFMTSLFAAMLNMVRASAIGHQSADLAWCFTLAPVPLCHPMKLITDQPRPIPCISPRSRAQNTCLPVMIKERAVFYRERFSRMYGPEVYALTYFLIELPWVSDRGASDRRCCGWVE